MAGFEEILPASARLTRFGNIWRNLTSRGDIWQVPRGQIWQNLVSGKIRQEKRYDKMRKRLDNIWRDLTSDEISQDWPKFRQDVPIFNKIRQYLTIFDEIWQDLERFGKM